LGSNTKQRNSHIGLHELKSSSSRLVRFLLLLYGSCRSPNLLSSLCGFTSFFSNASRLANSFVPEKIETNFMRARGFQGGGLQLPTFSPLPCCFCIP
jgi:hypothetical protein